MKFNTCFIIQNIFNKYTLNFQSILNKMLHNLLIKGEKTVLNEFCNSLFSLIVIYKNYYLSLTENFNQKDEIFISR